MDPMEPMDNATCQEQKCQTQTITQAELCVIHDLAKCDLRLQGKALLSKLVFCSLASLKKWEERSSYFCGFA